MNHPDDKNRPMAEADKQRSGASVGGMAASADAGISDALQKKSERQDETSRGRAATGQGAGAGAEPRLDLGGKNEPGSAAGTSARSQRPASEDRASASTGKSQAAESAKPSSPAAPAGSARPTKGRDDEEDEWRHEPVAPNDENPLESLGRSVTEAITGSGGDPAKPRK